ncbi:hypothetical protein N0V84_006629 [Fusarium piperis]|uniref:Uncharacterized protein n=1 Tax=Fusarium piperis TaxID=1435070 RepID=A0A9W9BP64_9HYPO|nr:hypothetical protein N0V84_006629 [Fusarium piperis]
MVRTKTRPRTLEERWPNGAPDIRLPPAVPITYENLTFNDHTGAPALMSWEKSQRSKSPLPPLASWIFYMIHPDVPRDFDGSKLYGGLEYDYEMCRGGLFRYEFFFLPGATAEECHAHFLGEMKARGTIWRQVRKVKKAIDRKKPDTGEEEDSSTEESSSDDDTAVDSRLPGLVWPKRGHDWSDLIYRGWFFMYPHAGIECRTEEEKARDVYLVSFDPIPEEWDEELDGKFNPLETPIYSKRMKAKSDEWFDNGLFGWMEMRKCTHWAEEVGQATCDAWELGWESW